MKFLRIDPMDEVIDLRLRAAGHVVDVFFPKDADECIRLLQGYQGLILRSRVVVSAEMMAACPNLRIIGRAGAGMENIDVAAASQLGIVCFNSPEGNRDAVGEHTLALLLALLKNIAPAREAIAHGIWDRVQYTGGDLRSQTVGILGLGHMGTAFAERLQGFKVRCIAYDKYRPIHPNDPAERVSLEELMASATVLSLHLPLTSETKGWIDHSFIQQMTHPFFLLNTARGSLVQVNALLKGLENGKILGAGLDVLEVENTRFQVEKSEHLEVLSALTSFPQVLITPHMAGITACSMKGIASVLADKILAHLHTS
jgi:D-3-phosphoglycerate dehydrogenase